MIKDLSDLVTALTNALSTKPLATIIAIFIVAVAYVGYNSYGSLQKLIITPSEEAARFEKQLENIDLVNNALEKLRVNTNADNVVIKQFHNGRHDLTGIPFTEASITFFVDPNDMHEATETEHIAVMDKTLNRVWSRIDSPSCIILNNPVDISSRRYFKSHELERAVVCPLVNLLNYPIGTLTVGISKGNTVSDGLLVRRTQQVSRQVTGYLNANTN